MMGIVCKSMFRLKPNAKVDTSIMAPLRQIDLVSTVRLKNVLFTVHLN